MLLRDALRDGPREPKSASAKKKKLHKPGAPEVDVLTPTSGVRVKWTPAKGCDAIKYTVTLTPQKSDTLEHMSPASSRCRRSWTTPATTRSSTSRISILAWSTR